MNHVSKAAEAIAHNVADVMENGPRLAWGRKTKLQEWSPP